MTTSRQPDVDLEAQARSFNVFDVEIQRHSKELWSYMRDRCPVSRSEAFGGFWALTRYAVSLDTSSAHASLRTMG